MVDKKLNKIGFGGGCHWCTEAVFQYVEGVVKVEQGWISSDKPNDEFSEAVIVTFDSTVSLGYLISVHLQTHSSSSNHAMRKKYRSAIYYFDELSRIQSEAVLQSQARADVITQVLPCVAFKENDEKYQNYYLKNPDSPFCQRYIVPKLEKIRDRKP